VHKNEYSGEMIYSIKEAGSLLGKSIDEVESLIKRKKLGFSMSDFGPTISNRQISSYLLGEKPQSMPGYANTGIKRRARKHYPRARTRR